MNVPTADKCRMWSAVVRGPTGRRSCRSAARRVSEKNWQKHDPQEPRSIWWHTRMDVIGFRVVVPEDGTAGVDRAEAEGGEEVVSNDFEYPDPLPRSRRCQRVVIS